MKNGAKTATELKYNLQFFPKKWKMLLPELRKKPRTTSHYVIKKYKSDETVENKPRSCRPKKLRLMKDGPCEKLDFQVNATKLTKIASDYMKITLQINQRF